MQAMLSDAQAQGARLKVIDPQGESASSADPVSRQMAPVLVFDTVGGMRVMEEEIFGPILPVLSYGSLDEAIGIINARPRPLALYWFGQDDAECEHVLARTVSGGASIGERLTQQMPGQTVQASTSQGTHLTSSSSGGNVPSSPAYMLPMGPAPT